MVRTYSLIFLLILGTLPLVGCGTLRRMAQDPTAPSGFLYSHFRYPLTSDLRSTPTYIHGQGSGKIIHIKEPISGYGIRTEFAGNAIGLIAKRYHLDTVLWADFEYFNLLGIWEEKIVHVYGLQKEELGKPYDYETP